jgi:hypothetical protein
MYTVDAVHNKIEHPAAPRAVSLSGNPFEHGRAIDDAARNQAVLQRLK